MRAAQYLRVSTVMQSAAVELQRQDIAHFAALHGFEIVRSYEDCGKSGLRLEGREALQELLGDVVSGRADYQAILVQDVSRWGRFQDPDEAAHYEYICRDAGIEIHYCEEAFDNQATPTSGIIKAVKRLMAAEFSRELSEKVKRAQLKWARRGFKMGGAPGFGFRRKHLSSDGTTRGLLKAGEMKLLQSDRVILVWGPAHEIATVRRIYHLFLKGGLRMTQIADLLNAEGTYGEEGRPWGDWTIAELLSNPKYIGEYSYGRNRRDLQGSRVRTPKGSWVRITDQLQPIIPREMFEAVRCKRDRRMLFLPKDEIFRRIRALLAASGYLSVALIRQTDGIPSPKTINTHFGPLNRLYALLGYYPLDLRRFGRPTPSILPGYIDQDTYGPSLGRTTESFPMSLVPPSFTAFTGNILIATGELPDVALATKLAHDRGDPRIIIFNDSTGEVLDLDLRGSPSDVLSRVQDQSAPEEPSAQPQARGRPRLGVTAREVTLLPRHWQWLGEQPGGASAALRKLVEQAAKANVDADAARRCREATYKVMYALAGHLPGYEDGLRALFAGDLAKLQELVASWPRDVVEYVLKMAGAESSST